MSKDTVVITERGTGKTERVGDIQVPDLWSLAMWLKGIDATGFDTLPTDVQAGLKVYGVKVLKTWHLAHTLLRHITEEEKVKTSTCGMLDLLKSIRTSLHNMRYPDTSLDLAYIIKQVMVDIGAVRRTEAGKYEALDTEGA